MNKIALAYVMNLLARRDYSAEEIRQKMTAKAFADDEIEAVLQHCQQKGWQSDQRFCENYLLSRSRKGYGPARIKLELQQKGVSSSLISEQLQNCDIDWFAAAEAVFNKKYAHLGAEDWTPATKQKAWRFMMNHGFYSDHFRHVFNPEMG